MKAAALVPQENKPGIFSENTTLAHSRQYLEDADVLLAVLDDGTLRVPLMDVTETAIAILTQFSGTSAIHMWARAVLGDQEFVPHL